MKITILGSGTGTPQLARNSSGLYIESSKVKAIVDMGSGTLRRMCEAKMRLQRDRPDSANPFPS